MCLVLFAYKSHPYYPFICVTNRDEFHQRAAKPAHFWQTQPDILAGWDVQGEGTWLGITRHGRFATVTNYRAPQQQQTNARSRGKLVRDFLQTSNSAPDYLQHCMKNASRYNGFNLIVGTINQQASALYYYSNRQPNLQLVSIGIHGLSNHFLNTPWPKVVNGKQALQSIIQTETLSIENLLTLLDERTLAPDALLPQTGIDLRWERLLSSRFVVNKQDNYGTRCSSVIMVNKQGQVDFAERSFSSTGEILYTHVFHFALI